MTTFDLMFTTEDDFLLWSIFMMEAPQVTGAGKHWCCERPSGWRELLCWNWGGTLTTEDDFDTIVQVQPIDYVSNPLAWKDECNRNGR